jgi:hypothetical protein
MDEINSQFGRLSTSAAEWKPGATAATRTASQPSLLQQAAAHERTASGSDLRASAVKEFVPGQGWSVPAATGSTTTASATSLLSSKGEKANVQRTTLR